MSAPSPDLHLAVALDGAGWHPAAWREPEARPGELFTALEDGFQGDEEALLRIRAARVGGRRPSSNGKSGTNGANSASKGA